MIDKKKKYLVGITGGIGAGKSTVSRVIREAGYPVLDADDFARQVVAPGSPALAEIRALFGDEAVLSDGNLNRAFVRREILRNPDVRKKLEAVTHPRIQVLSREAAEKEFQKGASLVFYEAPLLFEAKSDKAVDAVICVYADEETLIDRVMKRDGVDREHAKKILAAQMPQEEKCKRSDFLLKNEGSEEDLKRATLELIQEIRKRLD